MFLRSLIVSTLVVAGAAAHAGEVAATLRVTPESILPGLPLSFLVELRNSSDVSVAALAHARLEVQPEGSPQFVADCSCGSDGIALRPFSRIRDGRYAIAPRTVLQLSAAMDSTMVEPAYQWDPRLNRPGRYSVRIVMQETGEVPNAIATNWASFRIEAPEGVDAEAWSVLRAANENWNLQDWANAGGVVATTIADRYPASGYYPYALLLAGQSDRVERIKRVLGSPRGEASVYDYLKIKLAAAHDGARSRACWQGRLDVAEAEAREARRWIEDVIANTKFSFIREAAQEYAAALPSPKDIGGMYQFHKESMKSAIEPLTPLIQCVDQVGDEIVTRFGYTNPNRGGKWIDIGSRNNLVSPGTPDQGQPGYFEPGRRDWVFGVVGGKGKVPVWTLDGTSTAGGAGAPPCSSLPRAAVRPVLECVRTTNEAAVVFFGYDNPNRFPVTILYGEANRFEADVDSGPTAAIQAGAARRRLSCVGEIGSYEVDFGRADSDGLTRAGLLSARAE